MAVESFLDSWRAEGPARVNQGFAQFRHLVGKAHEFLDRRSFLLAAVYAEMAASSAVIDHPGIFVSYELEQMLRDIGRHISCGHSTSQGYVRAHNFRNILHVNSSVQSIGGPSNYIRRYILQDTEHLHSLALTRQLPTSDVPATMIAAVAHSGGRIYKLNNHYGSMLEWAKRLREVACKYDLIILHKNDADVIPNLAFANDSECPPIIYINHSDQQFWIGATITNVVVSLRESGLRLCQQRRGIPEQHNYLLPTIIAPRERALSRSKAKALLHLPEDAVVLLSIARRIKYRTVDGMNYADVHVPLLERYRHLILIIIGPGHKDDWANAMCRTEGRIISLPESPNTSLYLQAADIYVDSFPFISNTSLLEAGCFSLPLVSRFLFSNDSEVLSADLPGLAGNLIRVRNLNEYMEVLHGLVENEQWRKVLGEKTRKKVIDVHMGDNWRRSLGELYEIAARMPRLSARVTQDERKNVGEPDVFIPFVCSYELDLDDVFRDHLRVMPFIQRVYHWLRLRRKKGRFGRLPYLIPEWLLCRIQPLWRAYKVVRSAVGKAAAAVRLQFVPEDIEERARQVARPQQAVVASLLDLDKTEEAPEALRGGHLHGEVDREPGGDRGTA